MPDYLLNCPNGDPGYILDDRPTCERCPDTHGPHEPTNCLNVLTKDYLTLYLCPSCAESEHERQIEHRRKALDSFGFR